MKTTTAHPAILDLPRTIDASIAPPAMSLGAADAACLTALAALTGEASPIVSGLARVASAEIARREVLCA